MSEVNTLARPYAVAAFRLAAERDQLQAWSDMLQLLAVVAANPNIIALTSDPRVSNESLTALLLDIGGQYLNQEGQNFVRLLVENRRLLLLPEIAEQFERYKAEAEEILDVEAISAHKLNDTQTKKLTQALQKKFGRKVRLRAQVDDALLGGVIIRAGDRVIDGSVKGRLRELESQLSQ